MGRICQCCLQENSLPLRPATVACREDPVRRPHRARADPVRPADNRSGSKKPDQRDQLGERPALLHIAVEINSVAAYFRFVQRYLGDDDDLGGMRVLPECMGRLIAIALRRCQVHQDDLRVSKPGPCRLSQGRRTLHVPRSLPLPDRLSWPAQRRDYRQRRAPAV